MRKAASLKMNKLLANLRISKAIYVVLLLCNLALPLYRGEPMRFTLFQTIDVIIWLYGLLSQLGYFKEQIGEEINGKTLYENKVPFLQVGIIRIIEAAYLRLFKNDVVDWRVLAVLVGLDVFYAVFLLIDKARYVFESEASYEDYSNEKFKR